MCVALGYHEMNLQFEVSKQQLYGWDEDKAAKKRSSYSFNFASKNTIYTLFYRNLIFIFIRDLKTFLLRREPRNSSLEVIHADINHVYATLQSWKLLIHYEWCKLQSF